MRRICIDTQALKYTHGGVQTLTTVHYRLRYSWSCFCQRFSLAIGGTETTGSCELNNPCTTSTLCDRARPSSSPTCSGYPTFRHIAVVAMHNKHRRRNSFAVVEAVDEEMIWNCGDESGVDVETTRFPRGITATSIFHLNNESRDSQQPATLRNLDTILYASLLLTLR